MRFLLDMNRSDGIYVLARFLSDFESHSVITLGHSSVVEIRSKKERRIGQREQSRTETREQRRRRKKQKKKKKKKKKKKWLMT
jgi:hypothetical protein